MLEVQADTNDYSKLEMMVAPVAAEGDKCSAEGAAAGRYSSPPANKQRL